MQHPKPQLPAIRVLDPRFKYVPAAATDVTKTWAKHGWQRPNPAKQAKMQEKLNG